MNTTVTVAVLLIALPIAFNLVFAALAATFDYPSILRLPSDEVLARFRAGGTRLVMLWWVLAMTTVLLAPVAVLLSIAMVGASGTVRTVAAVLGVLAALASFLGLIRWPFLVPYLARVAGDPEATPARREAVDVVFQSFNRYLGVAVGEHLGYLLTGAWSACVGIAIAESTVVPRWIGIVGLVVGGLLVLCSFGFVGPFEPRGWKRAGTLTPVVRIAWSAWLVAVGTALLVHASR